MGLEDVRDFLLVDPDTYSRNIVERNDDFELMVFCWQSGQKSRIHDHAGSACGVRVLSGVATETVFERVAGSEFVRPVGVSLLHADGVTASFDADVHQVSNDDKGGELLVTLHVYSPPLAFMNTYDAEPVTNQAGTAIGIKPDLAPPLSGSGDRAVTTR